MNKAVNYDWDQNRIEIMALSDEIFAEDRCSKILEAIRQAGQITNGVPTTGLDHSWYANAFAPIGYVNKKAPKDYLSKLDKIILVRANMLGGSCQGRLVSTEIMYSKE